MFVASDEATYNYNDNGKHTTKTATEKIKRKGNNALLQNGKKAVPSCTS